MVDLNIIADKLLDLKPDPIPEFILLKEFKGLNPSSREYQNAYDRVCNHPFVKKIENAQNERGFWPPFHGATESVIRRCLSLGLENDHPCLKKVSDYLKSVLDNKESWDQFEKQDNVRWWSEMFVPLVTASMLSLIEPDSEILDLHRNRWANFAKSRSPKVIMTMKRKPRLSMNTSGLLSNVPYRHLTIMSWYYSRR